MEHCCYLTKICYVSLGMKRNTTKRLRSTPKEKRNHPKATRTKTECNTSKNWKSRVTPCARAPVTLCPWDVQEVGAGAPRAHGPVPCPRDPRAHGPNLPRAHGPPRMAG